MPSTATTCGQCGAAVLPGSRFCQACGATIPAGPDEPPVLIRSGGSAMTDAERHAHLEHLLIQATLGEFEILGELGRGGMATVYLAHETALDRKVAIKVVAPGLVANKGAMERFKREARTSASLSHPHIIPIHAVRETDDLLYFVMKFVEGRALDDIIRTGGAMPIRMVQAILFEVGQALAYAHRRGVVHRDVKPANIMLDGEGFSVVTDFGIAKPLDADALTASGAMIGTPYYMSPEQCAGKPVTGASDQYSLGVVAYQMITGHRPFSGDTIMEIMKGHFFEVPAPILTARHDCPVELADVVERMLAKEASDRFPSMDEALQAMACAPLSSDDPVRSQMIELARSSEAIQQLGTLRVPVSPVPLTRSRAAVLRSRSISRTPTPAPPVDPPPPAPPSRAWGPVIVVAVLALSAGALGATWWLRGRPSRTEAPLPAVATPIASAPLIPPAAPLTTPASPVTDSAATRTPAATAPDTQKAAATDTQAARLTLPPKVNPNPAESARRRRSDLDRYATRFEEGLTARWSTVIKEDIAADAKARFDFMVRPDGAVPNPPQAHDEGRLADLAGDILRNEIGELDALPASAGRANVPVVVTFTVDRVHVNIP